MSVSLLDRICLSHHGGNPPWSHIAVTGVFIAFQHMLLSEIVRHIVNLKLKLLAPKWLHTQIYRPMTKLEIQQNSIQITRQMKAYSV